MLIVLGDFLFWGYRPGVSLAIFAQAIFWITALRQTDQTHVLRPAIVMGLATLPILEYVQFLSIAILSAGLIVSLTWVRHTASKGLSWFTAEVWHLVQSLPFSGILAVIQGFKTLFDRSRSWARLKDVHAGALWRNWAFPAGGTLVLLTLLLSANPVLERFALQLFRIDLNLLSWVNRGLFWFGIGLIVWPLINSPQPTPPLYIKRPLWTGGFGVNSGSVLRALVVFNLFLGIQTCLDFSILLGGAKLPDGMTYAAYARHGAYPLMLTAMLAGAFTITARPFLTAHRLIKPMLFVWITQNVVLTISAMLRLNLYVTEYGLTYLRIYVLVWMGVVAVGLVLAFWQIHREHGTSWLLKRSAILGVGTLYVCAFVNFSALIITHTMARAADVTQTRIVDWDYVCNLGPTAAGPLFRAIERDPNIDAPSNIQYCFNPTRASTNWRQWDFRTMRTRIDPTTLSAL